MKIEVETELLPCMSMVPGNENLDMIPREVMTVKGDDGIAYVSEEFWREAIRPMLLALHDAIQRPMGTVPDSALEFYKPEMVRIPSNVGWYCPKCGHRIRGSATGLKCWEKKNEK